MKQNEIFPYRRGIGGWLTNYKRFVALPEKWKMPLTIGDYEHFESYITEQDVANIASLGVDHIRVGFDQIVLEEEPYRYRERTFLLLVSGGKIALCQRPENGLLGGMWEFPSAPGLLDAAGAARLLRSWGAVHAVPVPVGTARHLFTHREWRMTGYLAVLPDRTGDWVWGTPQDLKERYALPAACHFFRDRLAAFLAEPEQQSCNPGE